MPNADKGKPTGKGILGHGGMKQGGEGAAGGCGSRAKAACSGFGL